VRDATSGFRAYRDEIVRAIDVSSVDSDGYAFLVEALWRVLRAGGRVVEVPIEFQARWTGTSKINRREIALAALTLLRLRRDAHSVAAWQSHTAEAPR
jgi:hypothetical protein